MHFILAAEILQSPDDILQEDNITEETVISTLEVRVNSSTNDDSVEELSKSITDEIPQNNKAEPVYVNSAVDNTFLKVSVIKVNLSEDGIRISVKFSWNIVKDDKTTEDWIGCYKSGS